MLEGDKEIMRDIFINGPVQATFIVETPLYGYTGGVFSCDGEEGNDGGHAVIMVGWGEENGVPYAKTLPLPPCDVRWRMVPYGSTACARGRRQAADVYYRPHYTTPGWARPRPQWACDVHAFSPHGQQKTP